MRNPGAPKIEYTPELGQKICDVLASSDTGLTNLCKIHKWMPSKSTLYEWKIKYPDFLEKYMKAKAFQVDNYVEKCLEIAHDSSEDLIDTPDGIKPNMAKVARDRLFIDTVKWTACKLAPKIYGDKQTVESHVYSHEESLKELE